MCNPVPLGGPPAPAAAAALGARSCGAVAARGCASTGGGGPGWASAGAPRRVGRGRLPGLAAGEPGAVGGLFEPVGGMGAKPGGGRLLDDTQAHQPDLLALQAERAAALSRARAARAE